MSYASKVSTQTISGPYVLLINQQVLSIYYKHNNH